MLKKYKKITKPFTVLNIEQSLKFAKKLAKEGRLDEVKNICKEVDKKYPNNIRTKMLLNNFFQNEMLQEPTNEQINILINYYNKKEFLQGLDYLKILLNYFPQSSELFNFQGAMYSALEKYEEAIKSYKNAININPQFYEAYNNLGVSYINISNLTQALENYNKALSINPAYPDALINIGIIYSQKKEYELAINNFKKSLTFNSKSPQAYLNLSIVYNLLSQKNNAIINIAKAIQLTPNNYELYYNLGVILQNYKYDSQIKCLPNLILGLLKQKYFVQPLSILNLILEVLKDDSLIKEVLYVHNTEGVQKNLKVILLKISQVPLFMELLKVSPIANLEFENLLIQIRKSILLNIDKLDFDINFLKITSTLAIQCFLNEFIYNEDEIEIKTLQKVEKSVLNSLAKKNQPNFLKVAILASYRPLSEFNWHNKLLYPEELNELKKQQIEEIQEEQFLKNNINIFNNVKNNVSKKVKEQYESNPYPRWKYEAKASVFPKKFNEIIEDLDLKIRHQSIKKLDKINILIAGCGTGQQVVSVCSRYRNSNILAIDLSLNSLAYAKRKTSELGYNNVEFMLIDILDLAMLNKKFDLIESCGVLHHMEDPIKGWQVLEKCLHPEGLMKIGLYSDIARRYIKDVREHIAIKNIPLNFKNIKSFREEIKNSQERHNKNIFEQCDAFTLSNFRDLLFHVQEHRFKISQIEKSLKELNLEFSGFEIGKEVFNKFKSINFDREDVYNLKKWEVFEERYPDTFIGMYQFYCQKS